MRGCACEPPRLRPTRPGFSNDIESCNRCGKIIYPEYTSNEETVNEFFDRLADTFPGEVPDWFGVFRGICLAREYQGRDLYGHRHLGRDSAADGIEEAADGALYSFFTILKARREDDEEEWGLALTAAKHFAEAYLALSMIRSRVPVGLSTDPDELP